MKFKRYLLILLSIAMISMLFSSCNREDEEENVELITLHIPPQIGEYMFEGVTVETFYSSKGAGTFLENKYKDARIDSDGCLILTLKKETVSEWKNTFTVLQILQCVLGDTQDIGITVDYSKDFMDLMKDADTCGYEISKDFTKVVQSPEDNSWYFPFTTVSCALMQIFDGKSCTELRVEHIEIDKNGEVIETFVFPDNEINLSIGV